MRKVGLLLAITVISVLPLHAQIATPAAVQALPKAIFTPKPVYRSEWAKQGLAGKGIVLVTIDQQTGQVSGARMLQSTGNKQLDGAALEAYSQWRFQPGTGSQVKIPIEFATRPAPQPAKPGLTQPLIILIILAIVGAAVGILRRRT